MRRWAITVGINQYHFLQPLSYAQQDAQALRNFLVHETNVPAEQCLLLSDFSPPVWGKSTVPNRETIQGWLELISQYYVQPGDALWFFFSGYGICHQGRDYLLPMDGNPADLEHTALPLEWIFNRLRTTPAEMRLVLLDMSRSQGSLPNQAIGAQTAQLSGYLQIPTILSCQPGQFSNETGELQHGFFTTALIEGLRYQHHPTLANLYQYLSRRLPELSEHFWRPVQQPLIVSSPEQFYQLIMPQAEAVTAAWGVDPRRAYQAQTVAAGQAGSLAAGNPNFSEPPGYGSPGYAGLNGISGGLSAASLFNGPGFNGSGFNGSAPEPTNGQAGRPLMANLASQKGGHDHAGSSTNLASAAAATTVTTATDEVADEAATELDVEGWRSPLWWGSGVVAFLLMAVVGRNWGAVGPGSVPMTSAVINRPTISAPTQPGAAPPPKNPGVEQPPAAKVPTNSASSLPSSTFDPKKSDLKKNISTTIPQAKNQPVLTASRQRALIRSDQASPFWYAIQNASKVKPDSPDYQAAQQDIANWSQDIWAIATRRAARRSFDTAIIAATLVPQNQPVYAKAKQALPRWCSSLSQQRLGNTTQRRQAKSICQRQ